MHALLLVLASALAPALAFPTHAHAPQTLKRGLSALLADRELTAQIRDTYTRQRAELAASKRDIVGSLLNRTLDALIGPEDGIVGGLLNSLAASVEGLKYFPEHDHPFEWPGPTDQRGPCPGMNTLANHGYLPRNGIVTAGQVIAATSEVFNMGADIAALLVAGAVADNGDIQTLTFSIGGADARTNSLGKLGGALGTETGLDGHGRFNEGDASATRCDFYVCAGDNHNMQPALYAQMQARAAAHGGQYTVGAMAEHFAARYADSQARNPNFYFVPPSALVVIGATYFIPGFFSNGTIGAGGVANEASIASFEGAHFGKDGEITYVPERIPPQGWYRRGVPMLLPEVAAGILALYLPHPVAFGANGGSSSAFIPGPGLLPTSAQNVQGLGCFLYNAIYDDALGEFYNVIAGVEGAVNDILGLLDPALGDFIGCTPNFPDETGSNAYGGAASYMNATKGAPGAPKAQPCLEKGAMECGVDTNVYGVDEGEYVGNRYGFTNEDVGGGGEDGLPVVRSGR